MRFVKNNLEFIVVLFVVLALFAANFSPGTYLSGWDNLQTDLNPWLGVKRSFFSVWQEYQSFGLTSGLAHASDLTRSFFIWFVSFFLPQEFLRYFYHFLMVFLGGLGTLFFLRKVLKEKSNFALLGALFYILNYGSLQILFIPWESFSTFFAFLPWGLLFFIKTLDEPKTRISLLLFSLVNFIGTPSFYVQTIFAVYVLVLICITLGRYIETKNSETLKNAAFSFILILLINSFWLLPQLYSLFTQAQVITNAKNNLLATENVVYQNLEKGTLLHFLKMEGFYSGLYGKNSTLIFADWSQHFQNLFAGSIAIIFSLIFLFGLIYGLFKNVSYRFSFLLFFLLILVALLDKFPVFEQLNELIRDKYVINQVFRSPFTKFIIPYSILASYGFTMGLYFIHNFVQNRVSRNLILAVFLVLLAFYSFPSFKGSYLSKEMRVKIPSSYKQASDFFRNEDKNKRIALLPDYTPLGWFNYRWGYAGSGFLWYAIEQPIVSRTFDVWSSKSESFFWEQKAALEAEEISKFDKNLEKYDIDFLFYDKSLLPIVGNTRSIQYDRIDAILAKSEKIELAKKFGSISIYRVKHERKIENFIGISSALPNIGPQNTISNDDAAYSNYGDYQTVMKKPFDAYYPFLNLNTQTRIYNRAWNIFEYPSEFIFTGFLPFNPKDYEILPINSQSEFNLYKSQELTKFVLPLGNRIEKNTLIVEFPKVEISQFDLTNAEVENCSRRTGTVYKKNQGKEILIGSKSGATGCVAYTDEDLSQEYGYLVKITNENLKGQRLFFYVLDPTKEQSYLEDILRKNNENFIIAPRFRYGKGYSFIFHNNSYENIYSENKLKTIEVFPIPYADLKRIVFLSKNAPAKSSNFLSRFDTNKLNYYTYKAKGKDVTNDNNIILFQAFDPGWKAYEIKNNGFLSSIFPFLLSKELKDHVLVNNWANGWSGLSDNEGAILIVFLPQYLEYLGFLILLTVPVFLFRLKN